MYANVAPGPKDRQVTYKEVSYILYPPTLTLTYLDVLDIMLLRHVNCCETITLASEVHEPAMPSHIVSVSAFISIYPPSPQSAYRNSCGH